MEGRAPGKVIVAGEYFVVDGLPGLVVPLSRYVYTKIVEGPPILIANGRRFDDPRAHEVLRRLGITDTVITRSDIPMSSGLGSSAAFIVSLLRALGEECIEKAYELEKIYHGRPSGIDTTVSCVGKPIIFVKGEGFEVVDSPSIPAVLVYSHPRSKSVKELVEHYLSLPDREEVLEEYSRLFPFILERYREGDVEGLGEVLRRVARLLDFVYTPAMKDLDSKLYGEGAIAVKPTGAGGGGFLLALFPTRRDARRVAKRYQGIYTLL